ncbi:MAG: transporter substrate-binding domain-containing protein [Deltaproteobacteria bacterium]|jgi:cytidine deaminase|nr:transporter substrate-binding domain-containing protein [Deltaproteobacteria bacterium]
MHKYIRLLLLLPLVSILYLFPMIVTSFPASSACAATYNPQAMRVVYGFDREFTPFSYEDPGGKPVGFDIDIIESIFSGKATLSMRPLNWYSIPLELSSGAITITSGMILTPQRAKAYGFSEQSTFTSKLRFFTKVYKRVPNASFLRGQSVSVEEGSYGQALMEEFGGINIKPFKTRPLAIRALYNDEVDAFCGLDEPSYYLIRKLNYGAITTLGAPLGQAEMRIAVNRDRGDVLRLVNDGLRELIASGEYNRIYRKWFITELDATETDALLKAAKNATISSYAPYSKVNQGAAILTATGKIYTGCNVENPDRSLTISAPRAALARCVAENELELRAVVLLDHNGALLPLSQTELQSLLEFGRGTLVLTPDASGKPVSRLLAELLPNPVTGTVTGN